MELGKKLKQARLEAGLSQRQLCGERISRNMLSLIENGSAQPSMDTLRYLAQQLGKPISYFLEEQTPFPQALCMTAAREAFAAEDWEGCLQQLKSQPEDGGWEQGLLTACCCLKLAKKALHQDKRPYAEALLEQAQAAISTTPYAPLVHNSYCLLMSQARPDQAGQWAAALTDLSPALLLRSFAAIQNQDFDRSAQYLQAADDHSAQWHYLMAETLFGQGDYAAAAVHYQTALPLQRHHCYSQLELCYRNLQDFEKAYFYACKLREE